LVWEYFRSWRELARELAVRASIAERYNKPFKASKLERLIEKVREFDEEYFRDEFKVRLGYVLYRFQEYCGRTLIEHYRVEAMVLRTDGPDPEIDFVDVEWWLKEHSETSSGRRREHTRCPQAV
jgi:hypothetical protein